ncbi:hypothetical protein [Ornithinimicrobium cryptoxanthini]|uniref:hypothetical protein n=1 Tax=Ornithinimicrobium cryptoxanthini TaxID=2934161 RepID=UPI0021198B20|nr:hypothetical protein [Ornithinimicrobium cryptoxanthini]
MTAETARLLDRIRLQDGTHQDDLPFLERTLAQLFTQLGGRFDASQVDIAIRIKDRDKPGMRTSLELIVHGLPPMIGTSHLTDTKDAVNDAEAKVISQLQTAVDRRSERH